MKTPLKYLTIGALAIAALTWPSWKVNAQEAEETGEDVAAREAFRRLQLQDENGQIPPDAWANAYAEKDAMRFLPEAWSEFSSAAQLEAGIAGGVWTSIGPGNVGGRIRSIIINPVNPATMWAGSVSGGVWKTTTGGVSSWRTNTDFLSNLAVNCMAIDPANPNILYAGTGEGFFPIDTLRGNGIFKTTDGGDNWRPLSSTQNNSDFQWVNRLAISPTNSELLLAGTQFGLFRSENGGDDWVRVLATVGVLDVLFRPNDGTAAADDPESRITCLAATGRGDVYYSSDDGLTWLPSGGLPAPGALQRAELAYSRSNTAIAYASAIALYGTELRGELWKSTNGGRTFVHVGEPSGGTTASWYANTLWIDPTNPNTILVGGYPKLWRNTQGGTGTWDLALNIHQDQHVIVEHPEYGMNNNRTVFVGNDGGMYKIAEVLATPLTATNLNNSLGVTQFYGAAGHAGFGTIIGGTQDNGTVQYSDFRTPNQWHFMATGDGGFCAVDQQDYAPYFYGELLYLQIYRNRYGGEPDPNGIEYIWGGPGHANGIPHDCGGNPGVIPCANYTAPFVLDPNNTSEGVHRMLAGGKSLWRTTNPRDDIPSNVKWPEIKSPNPPNCTDRCININAIAVAEGNSNLIWVGYNDGSVFYTTNGTAGPSPSPTPSWSPGDPNNRLPRRNACTRITIAPPPQIYDPDVARTVYVTFGGFFPSTTDTRGNVWKREPDGVT